MAHFAAERPLIDNQVRNRVAELEATVYRHRIPITGWESVETGVFRDVEPIPASGWAPFDVPVVPGERIELPRTPRANFRERFRGAEWGDFDVTRWFRARVIVPAEMAGETVVALLDPGAEALCWVNGAPLQGLDPNRREVVLVEKAAGGETYEIAIEASATPNQYDDEPTKLFRTAFIAIRDEVIRSFAWDLQVAQATYLSLTDGSETRLRMQDHVDKSIKLVDLNLAKKRFDAFRANVEGAQEYFRTGMKRFRAQYGTGQITWIGHSHIDTAWLWPLRETRRKCSRTFSTVLRYMELYPDYTYSQGQPQLYAWMKEHYPTIWAGIKRRVAEGRWEATGGGWVEQDSNVAGAEALVRQYLYGKRFFRQEFGVDATVVWLPDAFGFPLSMPQILKKCGMRAFGTTKINWSQYNRFPYSAFLWKGLDGTEIFSFMPPGSYNSSVDPGTAISHWNTWLQKDLLPEMSVTYGHGDGGGGPAVNHIENLRRIVDVAGLPKGETGTLEGYIDRALKQVDADRLPVFNDELYLELHRACQTTQARTKRNNRKGELLFRDAEMLSAIAMLGGSAYPQERIVAQWKPFLTNQFHDILPGSSVNEVYETANRDYARIMTELGAVRELALAALGARIDTTGEGTPIVVHNTLGWTRSDVAAVSVPAGDLETTVYDAAGKVVPSQYVRTSDGRALLLFAANDVPALGYATYRLRPGAKPVRNPLKATVTRLENDFFRVELTKTGTIRRIVDKRTRRDVVASGSQANELQMFDDRPFAHDAWDIDFNVDENRWPVDDVVSIAVTEMGPVRATVRVVKTTGASTITQDISIWRTIPRIDFATSVEWWEKRRLLKVAFPVEVRSRTATYEIQYGAIERPTHQSNTWDRGKFEVPGHRWIDLSEADYGVSLLNDCKYGFDTHDNVMRISLLRAPVAPDPKADEGHHDFAYALYPHAGDWRKAETVRRGYEFNAPLLARAASAHAGELPAAGGFCAVDRANVVIDCVKKAEDSDAVIVRLYEAHGARGPVTLSFARTPRSVTECDLMEENDAPVDLAGPTVRFAIKPWEIRTFKVVF